MSILSNLRRVLISKIFNVLIGVMLGLVLPLALSINDYAYVNTFLFYTSYIGLLHFGFVDGIYLKYGGIKFQNINLSEFKFEHVFFIGFQVIVSVVVLLFGTYMKDKIIIYSALAIVPINGYNLFQYLLQATGEFEKFTTISNMYNLFILIAALFPLILKMNNSKSIIIAYLVAYFIIFIILEIQIYFKLRNFKLKINFSNLKNIYFTGVFVLLANLAVTFFYATDRWFVKIYLTNKDFAYYSFAINMLMVISVLINSISVIMYNYFIKINDDSIYDTIVRYMLIVGAITSSGYFAFSGIINLFLKKYIPSLHIISILFMGIPFMLVINICYINIFKAKKMERDYLKMVIKMLTVCIILNFIAVNINKTTISIAIATTIAFGIWYVYGATEFKTININKRDILFLTIFLSTFIVTSIYFNWLIGGIIYLIIILLMIFILFKNETAKLKSYIMIKK